MIYKGLSYFMEAICTSCNYLILFPRFCSSKASFPLKHFSRKIFKKLFLVNKFLEKILRRFPLPTSTFSRKFTSSSRACLVFLAGTVIPLKSPHLENAPPPKSPTPAQKKIPPTSKNPLGSPKKERVSLYIYFTQH